MLHWGFEEGGGSTDRNAGGLPKLEEVRKWILP